MDPSCAVESRSILGMRADATSYPAASSQVLAWARAGESRYVAVATVNNVMEAYDSPAFRAIMNAADLVTPDGMPLVWALRLLGIRTAAFSATPVILTGPRNISAWAAREGVDLLGVDYRDPQSGNIYHALRGVGLQAWEIPNERWATIEKDLAGGTLPALDTPAGDLLMHYDAASGRYQPLRYATFLFITRNGLQGILRVTTQVTRKMTPQDFGKPYVPPDDSDPIQDSSFGPYLGIEFDYSLFYQETAAMRAEKKAREEATATAARKANALAEAEPTGTGQDSLLGASSTPVGSP